MSDKNLAMTLSKVIIAAAWADGTLTNDEINSLKDLLFRMPNQGRRSGIELTAKEWAILDMYIQSPVGPEERARLVEDLTTAMRSPRDRALAIEALEELLRADGEATAAERAVVDEIKTALESVDLGIISQIGRLISGPVQRRSDAMAHAPNREAYFDDFVRNKIYYAVSQRLRMDQTTLDIPESDLRKLSLAGGLMARVAHANQRISPEECEVMVRVLQADWGINRDAASLVAEVAVSEVGRDLDFYRLTREFFTSTTEDERLRFLEVLFDVALSDGDLIFEENEEIRRIALGINMSPQQFVAVKAKVRNV